MAPDRQRTLKFQLSQLEEELICRALQEEKGDRLAAAARLGISKSSLYAKIEQYHIQFLLHGGHLLQMEVVYILIQFIYLILI